MDYRGYRLMFEAHGVGIWYGSERVDAAMTMTDAKKTVDQWQDAR